MTMTGLIETAIALAFIFLLFSLLVSAVNEVILGHLTRLRSRVLEDGLKSILSNQGDRSPAALQTLKIIWELLKSIVGLFWPRKPAAPNASFAEKVMAHPLVQGQTANGQACPDYLHAKVFADAVLGVLMAPANGTSATLTTVDQAQIQSAVDKLTDPNAKGVLASVLAGAKDITEARKQLADWFDGSMDSVTSAYKRHTQFWLYVWTTLIVVWLNVDTIEITRRLVADAQFRGAIVERAEKFATNTPAASFNSTNAIPAMSARELQAEINRLQLPLGWGAYTNSPPNSSFPRFLLIEVMPNLMLNGTSATNPPGLFVSGVLSSAAPCPQTHEGWWLKLFGLVITIGAVSQGAPFWFDLLNRFTNLRAGANRPPLKP